MNAILAGRGDVVETLANIVGYFLGIFTAAGLLFCYIGLARSERTLGPPEYAYIMVLMAGFAVGLFLIFTLGDK
ncbi:hypothetical protein ACQPZJ_17455 [Actinoplanes sp. CA-054009]